jgi:hypothetical protein
MSGEIAGPSVFSLELVGLIVGLSMIIGAVDLIRQPGWAWKRAQESKTAYLILVVLVPIVGLALYVFKGRPKVSSIAAAGRAASLPFERFGEEAAEHREDGLPSGHVAAPVGLGSFGEIRGTASSPWEEPIIETPTYEVSETFFSSGGTGTATRAALQSIGLARAYRPRQRTSLNESEDAKPTVPAGWKADPTGRHQFRYWDGFHWTENVADAGSQSRDSVAS